MRLGLVVLLVLRLSGCEDQRPEPPADYHPNETEPFGQAQQSPCQGPSTSIAAYYRTVKRIELESAGASRLFDPISLSVASERIAVADRGDYSVKIFGVSGAYLGQIGVRGQSPGRFLLLADARFVDDTTIVALDVNKQTLTVFSVPIDKGDWRVRNENPTPLRPIGTFAQVGSDVYVGGIGPWLQGQDSQQAEFKAVHTYRLDGSWRSSMLDRTDEVRSLPQWPNHATPLVAAMILEHDTLLTVAHMFGSTLTQLELSGERVRSQDIPEVDGFKARDWNISDDSEVASPGSPIVSLTAGRRSVNTEVSCVTTSSAHTWSR